MNIRSAVLTASVLLALFGTAHAETVMQCGGSSGHGYWLPGPIVSEAESGWTREDIAEGSIALTVSADNKIDILFKDSAGLKSASSYGADVVLMGMGERTVTVMVRYSNTVLEVYSFDTAQRRVLWTQHNMEQLISKVAVLTAECE